MPRKKDDGKRSRDLEKKKKRREKRKASKTPRDLSKSPSGVKSTGNYFSRAAWKHNKPSSSVDVFKTGNKSKISFNRDAWQSPTPANRPTVTEPNEVEISQEEHQNG